jgi:hypothetical protein
MRAREATVANPLGQPRHQELDSPGTDVDERNLGVVSQHCSDLKPPNLVARARGKLRTHQHAIVVDVAVDQQSLARRKIRFELRAKNS